MDIHNPPSEQPKPIGQTQLRRKVETFYDKPPSAWLLALELHAFWELGALLPAWPLLAQAPRGDAHAVMVLPDLTANDASTILQRRYLQSLGYGPWVGRRALTLARAPV